MTADCLRETSKQRVQNGGDVYEPRRGIQEANRGELTQKILLLVYVGIGKAVKEEKRVPNLREIGESGACFCPVFACIMGHTILQKFTIT
jgi:hypothetical protein